MYGQTRGSAPHLGKIPETEPNNGARLLAKTPIYEKDEETNWNWIPDCWEYSVHPESWVKVDEGTI